jgi:drug/metabolite transporter (DMT)-like permease
MEYTGTTLASMAFLILFCSIVAFLLYNYGLEKLPASSVAMFIYISPLCGILLAPVILGEPITAFTVAWAALIFISMYPAEKN